MKVLRETNFPELKLFNKGKVRDIYFIDEDKLLFITTDRLSAFDVVMKEPIPYKGIVLNQLSLFWFEFIKDIIANHVITSKIEDYPSLLQSYKEDLEYRSMICFKTEMIPFEFVVRGYLFGSAWNEYKERGEVSGIKLPKNMKKAEKLPEPIFTPAIKASSGHDVNVDEAYLKDKLGSELAMKLKTLSLNIFEKASQYCEEKGIIIADTKFEFGLRNGNILICDEILTPDSSRYWIKEKYLLGAIQDSLDKQPVRDYLLEIGWDKNPPPPSLPDNIIKETSQRYLKIYKIITGLNL